MYELRHSKYMNWDGPANGRLEPEMLCLVIVISMAVEENYGGRGRETKDWHTRFTGREKPLTACLEHPSSTTTRIHTWKCFLYFNCHWETSPDRANQGLVQTGCNFAVFPADTKLGLKSRLYMKTETKNQRRAGTSRFPCSSLQPQGTELLLSNPIHSSKEGMVLIYSGDII